VRKVCPIIHIIGLIGSTRTWYTMSKHIPQATHWSLHHTPGWILVCCSIFDMSRFRLFGRFSRQVWQRTSARILLLALCLLLFAGRFLVVARLGNRSVLLGCTLVISIFGIRFGRHVARNCLVDLFELCAHTPWNI
jgi:hypothetical protein